jgi:hypothetical protein
LSSAFKRLNIRLTERRCQVTQEVYKLWQMRFTNAWYQLSEEEQEQLGAKIAASLEEVGGEIVVSCTSAWADEKWLGFGVEKYPSLEAAQQHTQNLWEMGWYRYIQSTSTLGVEFQPE